MDIDEIDFDVPLPVSVVPSDGYVFVEDWVPDGDGWLHYMNLTPAEALALAVQLTTAAYEVLDSEAVA